MASGLGRRIVIAATGAALLRSRPARASRRLLRIANNSGPQTAYGAGCRALAAAIASDSLLSAQFRPEVYDNAELGEEVASFSSARKSTVEIVAGASGALSAFLPEIGLLDMPFLFRDAVAARAVLDGEIGADLIDRLAPKGLHVLCWAENGVRQITANKPIRRPVDLAGLKLRVPVVEVMVAGFRALGADPRGLPFPLVHEALRTGEFDAQENPVGNIEAGHLYDVQKYISLTRHTYSAAVFLLAPDLLDDLTGQQKSALLACGEKAKTATRDFADAAERDGLGRLRALGMTIVDDVDIAAFSAAAKPNISKIGDKISPALTARLIRAGA
jgi:tripartite ATP-independent transporter DctP family solute receptor